MSKAALSSTFPWTRYSKKLSEKVGRPRAVGYFRHEDVEDRGLRLAKGEAGSLDDGNAVQLYWLVDAEDGCIVDAKFQVFGQSALIAAAEAACQLLVGKNYDQARRISTELIDKELRDRSGQSAFPSETYPHLNLVLEAIDLAAETCMDLPLPSNYVAPPVTEGLQGESSVYPGWEDLPVKKKLAVIEEVVARDIRPYIELDAGGIEVLNILNEREVIIAYSGACTSCFSATGATLSYIQQVLRHSVHPDLTVVPDMESMFQS